MRSKVARREDSPEWWCASPESDDVRKRHKIWIILWPRSISDLEPNVPLGPFFGPTFERNSTSIFSFELRNWIKNGPDTDTHGHTDVRTDTHDFLGPPLHNKPFGQQRRSRRSDNFTIPLIWTCFDTRPFFVSLSQRLYHETLWVLHNSRNVNPFTFLWVTG